MAVHKDQIDIFLEDVEVSPEQRKEIKARTDQAIKELGEEEIFLNKQIDFVMGCPDLSAKFKDMWAN